MEALSGAAFAHHASATKAMGAKGRGLDGCALGWHAGRVCMKRRGSGAYAFELVWLRFGRLLVHGDISPVIISAPGASFRETVHRLARSHVDYLADKVVEGSRRHDAGRTIDRGVFLSDLREIRRNIDDYGDLAPVTVVDTAIEMVGLGGEINSIKAEMYSDGVDPEILSDLGRVIDSPVWYAHAALRAADAAHGWACPECAGQGRVVARAATEECATCGGRGAVDERPGGAV